MSEYKSRINVRISVDQQDWKLFKMPMKKNGDLEKMQKKFSKCRIQKNKQNL